MAFPAVVDVLIDVSSSNISGGRSVFGERQPS